MRTPPLGLMAALLLIASPLLTGCAHDPAGRHTLTVMTYNIHHGEGTDGKLDLPRIAEVIRAQKPDLVALQEVDDRTQRTGGVDQAADLGRLTGMHASYGPAMDYQGGQYGNAILSRGESKLSKMIHLPGSGGKHEPRCALAVGCDAGGETILFATTHLDFTAEPSDRLRQATIIADFFASEHRPMILAGDFNCDPDSPPLRLLAKEGFTVTTTGEPPTCPSDDPRERIDHVLIKPGARWTVVNVKVVDEEVASDHRPVVVKLELLPPGGR